MTESIDFYDEDRGQFVKVDFDLLDNEEFLRKYKSKHMLYLLLRRYIVRRPFNGDLGLHEHFWKNELLASSKSVRWLARKFDMKKTNTIEKWLKELKGDGIFETEKVDVGNHIPQTVYIFGKHNSGAEDDYREDYFVTDRFLLKK